MSQDLPVAALVGAANESETAMTITLALADFERIRGFTDIKRQRLELLRQDFKYVDADANRYWRTLEQLGMGSIIYSESSKNVKPVRFIWHYNMKEVMAVALGDKKPNRSSVVEAKPVRKIETIVKAGDKPVNDTPRIVKTARQNEMKKISLMSTDPKRMELKEDSLSDKETASVKVSSGSREAATYSNAVISGSSEPKTIIVPIRDGEVDIEVKIPANMTLAELETLSKVLRRNLS